MSRKAKLAGLFAASQQLQEAEGTGKSDGKSDFVEATTQLDGLGSLVRDLLLSCKSDDFSEEKFKKGLQGVKQYLARSPP